MSYLVLARKWRPETFSQVVGQKHVVTTLAAAVRSGRIAHAYLFAGPRGVGKTTVARILAKALNCEQGPAGEPCGSCASCVEIASGRSLDVIEIDGASNRRIEDARGIREAVQYAPLSGRMKVYIIDEAHMLTREAFNALLKTLEEPPPHVVFVLATTEPSRIPETIASRCQRFDFHRVAASDIEARLSEIATAEHIAIDPAAVRLLAARADGSVRDAQGLFDQLISAGMESVGPDDVAAVLGIPRSEVFTGLTDAVAARDTGGALRALSAALDAGFDPGDLAGGMVEHLRDLLVRRATGAQAKEAAPGTRGGSASLSEDELVRLLRIAVEAEAQARWSTQPSLLLELALARMARLPRTVELAEIVEALASGRGEPSAGSPDAPPAASGGHGADAGERANATKARGPSAGACDERWEAVVARVRAQKPALASFISDAVAMSPSAGRVSVHVPNGSSFHRQQLQDRGNMMLLERAASEVFGQSIRITLAFAEQPKGIPKRSPAEGPPPHEASDPVVRKVLEMFDGEIKKTRREE